MSQIYTEENIIKTQYGEIYTKKWTPSKTRSAVPVILLHDSLGAIDLWRDFPQILSERLSQIVIAYDRLGFGRSSRRMELPSIHFIEEEADLYFPMIKEGLFLSEYILLGHSVGGGMAINIAAGDKDYKGVITMASQAFVEEKTVAGIKKAKRAFEKEGQMERLEKWHGKKAEWVLKAWTDIWLSHDFAGWSLENCIEKVICPVLAIHGDKDEYGSEAFAEFIAGRSGGVSEILIIKDCGHMPHKEKRDEVITRISEFLGKDRDK